MDQEYYIKMAKVEQDHWWYVGRREIIHGLIQRIKLPEKARILDAGCGTGGSLKMLSPFGEVYAMEFNEEALEVARRKGYVSLARCSLPDDLPFSGIGFDLIVLLDVLEHVDRDRASLEALFERLNPGGWLLLTVPSYQWMWSEHDDKNHHFRRYTMEGVRKLFDGLPFEVKFYSYFNSILFPIAVGMRFARKILGLKQSLHEMEMPGDSMNEALLKVFRSEKHLVRFFKLPFGLSCLLLAQRTK